VRCSERLVGLTFNSDNDLCVVDDEGTLYWINPNKSGRTIWQSYVSPSNVAYDHANKALFIALPSGENACIVSIDKEENEKIILLDTDIQGLLWEREERCCTLCHQPVI